MKRTMLHAMITMIAIAVLSIGAISLIYDDGTSEASAFIGDADQFDLIAELEAAESGDIITMPVDCTISTDATVKFGVILETNGHSLTISNRSNLVVNGMFTVAGDFSIYERSSLIVSNEGEATFVSGNVQFLGTIEVLGSGIITIPTGSTAKIVGEGYSFLNIDGTFNFHGGSISIRDVTLTGTLSISDGLVFTVLNLMNVGTAPTLTTEMVSDATVTGKITLLQGSGVMVYGKSTFNANNLKNPSTKTQFMIKNDVYATQYGNTHTTRTLSLPDGSELKDYSLKNWKDSSGNIISSDNPTPIGKHSTLYGETELRLYDIRLSKDDSIRWIVDGTVYGSEAIVKKPYGTNIKVDILLNSGYTDLPSIRVNGVDYEPRTNFKVLDNATFITLGGDPSPGMDLTTILLIVLGIVILILLFVIFYIRFLKPVPQPPKKKK